MVVELVITATGHSGKCSPQHVLSAVRKPKYHSNHAATSQYIAATAIIRSREVDKTGLEIKVQAGIISSLYLLLILVPNAICSFLTCPF